MSTFLTKLKVALTPTTIIALLTAAISTAVAFGAPLTSHETAELLVLGNSVALVLLAHGLSGALRGLTPQTILGLVTAIIGVAASFGLPITAAQSNNILTLTSVIAGLLLAHGAVSTAAQAKLQSDRESLDRYYR